MTETTVVEARHAFDVETHVKKIVSAQRVLWVELAASLHEIWTDQLYRHLGHVSFDEWIASPDIDIGRRWAYDLIQTHREFAVKLGVTPERLAQIEPSKLPVVLPAIRRKQITLEEALSDAQSLSRGDLRERYSGPASVNGSAGRGPDTSTGLEATSEREIEVQLRCPTCGQHVTADQLGSP